MTSSLVIESESIETSFSSLYFLVFKESGVFKIGKANDVYTRSLTLEKWLGPVSYDESFELYTTEKTVFKLEKALHFFMAEFAVEFTHGDGRTELFELDSIGTALDYLKLYAKSSSVPIVVNEGVVVPERRLATPKKSLHQPKAKRKIYDDLDKINSEDSDDEFILSKSNVFCVTNTQKSDRKIFDQDNLNCSGNWSVAQSGQHLLQEDLDVLLVMHFMSDLKDGIDVYFTRNELIKNLGRTSNAKSYERLVESIERLFSSKIEIFGKKYFMGNLIAHASMSKECHVMLRPEVFSMIVPKTYKISDLIFRLKLTPIGKWLHTYYLSYSETTTNVESIYKLTGSSAKSLRTFKVNLKIAVACLVDKGFFTEAKISEDGNFLSIKRNVLSI